MANNKIQIKRTSVSGRLPNTTNSGNSQYIDTGELALNIADGVLYTSNGALITIGANLVNQNITGGANAIALTNATSNWIYWTSAGTAAPTFTTRSAGTKVVLYPTLGASQVDYAFGINAGTLWSSIPGYDGGQFFKWYGGETEVASLSGTGNLLLNGSVNAVAYTVGSSWVANTLGVYMTMPLSANGGVGSAGQVLTSNGSTGSPYWSTVSGVNTSAQYTWTNTQTFANTVTINNNKALNFQTVNTSAYATFIQQNDDNFVFYTTNASYGQRAVWSIYANNNTANLRFSTQTTFNGNVDFNVIALYANGSPGSAGQVLASNGTATYWVSPGAASVNTSAQFAWSNLHTFQANVNFTGNNITVTTNTGSVMFAGAGDTNWRIGRSTGATTKFYYSNNTLDILAAASNLEGVVIGQPGGNTYLETGYAGTFTKNPIYVGNSSVNVTINSTSFTGTSDNALNLGGVAAGSYVNTSGSYTISGVHTHSGNVALQSGLSANGGFGTAGQVLTSNGTTGSPYWSTVSGVNTSAQYTFTNTITFSNTITLANISANGTTGSAGQTLTSDGTKIYWSTPASGGTDYGIQYAMRTF